jgi:hypothetical protein
LLEHSKESFVDTHPSLIITFKVLDKSFVVQVKLILLVSVTKKKEEKKLSTFFHAEDRNFEKGRHDT